MNPEENMRQYFEADGSPRIIDPTERAASPHNYKPDDEARTCQAYEVLPSPQVPTPDPLEAFPNLAAIVRGCISGRFSEWPLVKSELWRYVTLTQRELAELNTILGQRGHDIIGAAKEAMQDVSEARAEVERLKDSIRVDTPKMLHLNDQILQENNQLRAELDRLDPGVHSCSDTCERPVCVLKRENAALRAEIADWIKWHGEVKGQLQEARANAYHMEEMLRAVHAATDLETARRRALKGLESPSLQKRAK